MAAPEFATLIESPEHSATILSIRRMASEHGYNLLKLMNEKASADGKTFLQIATSESLTCGTIMTLLTEIPWGGYMKYGCFGVYDTDAKRVFNHVTTDDVYTHKCASEMAIGVLKNSNATIAIAVTGNSMPLNEHVEMMGEVFISVAGYNEMGEIIFVTNSINACNDSGIGEMQSLCGKWYKTIATDKRYNSRNDTAALNQQIRYYTAFKAYELCIQFINEFNPQVPDEIKTRKEVNLSHENKIHVNIPVNKYEFGGSGTCTNEQIQETCAITGDRQSEKINLYKSSGGTKKKRKKRSIKKYGQ